MGFWVQQGRDILDVVEDNPPHSRWRVPVLGVFVRVKLHNLVQCRIAGRSPDGLLEIIPRLGTHESGGLLSQEKKIKVETD